MTFVDDAVEETIDLEKLNSSTNQILMKTFISSGRYTHVIVCAFISITSVLHLFTFAVVGFL